MRTFSTVLMIVLPPGDPVTSASSPFLVVTMVGVIEQSMRFPGSMRLGSVPISPVRLVKPGFRLKSPISLLSRMPVPLATTCEP